MEKLCRTIRIEIEAGVLMAASVTQGELVDVAYLADASERGNPEYWSDLPSDLDVLRGLANALTQLCQAIEKAIVETRPELSGKEAQ